MGRINTGRVLLGGLLAGVVINVGEFLLYGVILGDQYESMMEMHNLTEAGWAMIGYVISAFVLGILIVWLYAAIRPRFGPGMKTAAIAGAATWVAAGLLPFIWMAAMGFSYAAGTVILGLVWGLVEYALAGAAGGWFYQENGGGGAAAAAAPSSPPPSTPPSTPPAM